MNRGKWSGLGDRLADLFELPKEVVLDLPQVSLVGNGFLKIENHRGIIEYQPELIRVNASRGEMAIRGKRLIIRTILPEEILISGKVAAIELNNWGEF